MAGVNRRRGLAGWPKVVLFGDSLTQESFSAEGCWGALVSNHLLRKCDVLNRGFSGYTTRQCRAILPSIIGAEDSRDVVMFIIFLGANDSNDKTLNPKQHVPLEEFKENLVAMVDYLNTVGIGKDRVVIVGPPVVDEEVWTEHLKKTQNCVSGKTEVLTQMYSDAAAHVSQQCGVEFIDVIARMKKSENWKSFLRDGLHFSTAGSELVFDLFKLSIDRRTSNLAVLYPEYPNIDFDFHSYTMA